MNLIGARKNYVMEFDAKIAAFIKNIKMTKRLKVFNGCDKEVF